MKNKIAIYGAGGFGREMLLMISQINEVTPTWDLVGFFDDGIPKNETVEGSMVLGGIHELNSFPSSISLCVAVADPLTRKQLVSKITNKNIEFPVLAHPSSMLGDQLKNKFGKGSIVTAGAILTTGISIGDFAIINLSTTIGHDVCVGDFCTVMPACSISGNISIGACCLLGTGSRLIQGVKIGQSCIIGAGSVVTKSFASDKKIMGVPARVISKS
ncbi:MAG: acetyltransferase [Bacteroidetes bacterium]|nr:acetyltransferase [Bacteroidota bacterium]